MSSYVSKYSEIFSSFSCGHLLSQLRTAELLTDFLRVLHSQQREEPPVWHACLMSPAVLCLHL